MTATYGHRPCVTLPLRALLAVSIGAFETDEVLQESVCGSQEEFDSGATLKKTRQKSLTHARPNVR